MKTWTLLISTLMLALLSSCKNELKYRLGPQPILPTLPYVIKGYVSSIAGNQLWYFNGPMDSVKDNNGNFYVIDDLNCIILKFSTDGAFKVLAGSSGVQGSADGTGSSATFRSPSSIAIDNNQNLIIADSGNHLIRKVTLDGVVTTIAGNGSGFVDGNGTSAKFNNPLHVAVDSANNIFVSDNLNHAIRKITPAGDVTTFAGGTQGYQNGTGTAARFYRPQGLAFDSLGNLFVADAWNFKIRKITPGAVVSLFAGGAYGNVNGNGAAAQFKFPVALAIDSQNNIFISDPDDHTIRKITPAQDVTTFAGGVQGFADGTGSSARFNFPTGLFIDDEDVIHVADYDNYRIRKLSSLGAATTYLDNSARNKDGQGRFAQFNGPRTIVQDSMGNFFIADSGNTRIRKMTPTGYVSTFAGSSSGNLDGIGTAAQFNNITGITIDKDDNLYVADYANNNIRKITPLGVVTTLAGGTQGSSDGTGAAAQFFSPTGITIDKDNNLYVSDTGNHNIRKITPAGVVTTIAGGGVSGNIDGVGTNARFYSPYGLALDSKGNLFVSDLVNNIIRKISKSAEVTTFAGNGTSGSIDGVGTSALLKTPYYMTIDSQDNIYFGELINYTVRKVTPEGIVSTIAGSGTAGLVDGYKSNASFAAVAGMVVGKEGYLYLTDFGNGLVRKIE